MRIKKYIVLLCVILLGIFISACEKDFLTLENPNQMTGESFWRNAEDVESALTATYALLQHQWWDWYWAPGEMFMTLEVMSDLTDADIFYPISGHNEYNAHPNMYTVRYFWQENYKMIYAANQVIENAPTVESLTEDQVNEYVAEAKFLRAFANFQLVNLYGNIVKVTSVPTDPSEFYKPQSPADEIYALIEEDLKFAKDYLPTSWPDAWLGRATRGAAASYLGKVYMFQEKWAQAETEFKDVTTLGYSLVNDLYSLFTGKNEYSSESIFEINFTADRTGGRIESQSLVPNYQSWLGLWPTDHLKALFMDDTTAAGEKSARTYASIVFDDPNCDIWYFNGQTYEQYFGEDEDRAFYKKYSYYDPTEDAYEEYSVGINYVIMRYADVLLMLGEALNEQGKTAEAIPYINQVRNRAGSVPVDAGMSQSDLRHHIREVERPLELCNETGRFFDLVRWYKSTSIQAAMQANNGPNWDQFDDGVDEIWPIPARELSANPEVIQNPGY